MLSRKTETCENSFYYIFILHVAQYIKWLHAEEYRTSNGRSVAGRQTAVGGLKLKGLFASRLGS